ncbi:hypothetical protein KUV89_17000 [Marinobacter hydrocarbonoclasticus]|nr:hypothetical protein [Marinobacter nauticus]
MKIWTAALLGALISLPAFGKAPFGLQWGQALNGMEHPEPGNPIGVQDIENPPKPHSKADSYWGFGTTGSGLQKVVMNSSLIEGDAYGRDGKALYDSLVKALIGAGYQEENRIESVGHALWDEADEFYQCLGYDGCGYWMWFGVDAAGDKAMVQIEGRSRGTGRVRATFESARWSDVLNAGKDQQNQADSEAF